MNGTRWQQVYDQIVQQILAKELQPGDQVPTELSLCARLGYSRATVRTAMTQLVADGYITAGGGCLGRRVLDIHPVVPERPDDELRARLETLEQRVAEQALVIEVLRRVITVLADVNRGPGIRAVLMRELQRLDSPDDAPLVAE